MKKILMIALSALAVAAHAESATQSVQLQNTTVKVTGTPKITAPDGQTIRVTNTTGAVTIANVSAPANGKDCSLHGVTITGNANIRCAQ